MTWPSQRKFKGRELQTKIQTPHSPVHHPKLAYSAATALLHRSQLWTQRPPSRDHSPHLPSPYYLIHAALSVCTDLPHFLIFWNSIYFELLNQKLSSRSFHRCGAMGSAAFREYWDVGSIPSPAQWVKDPALPQLWLCLQLWLGSDHWPRSSIYHGVAKKKKKKKSFPKCLNSDAVVCVPVPQLHHLLYSLLC